MFRFRETKVSEKITDQTVKIAFDPDKRVTTNSNSNNMKEIHVFDPDVRGCYRTIMVPVDAGAKD